MLEFDFQIKICIQFIEIIQSAIHMYWCIHNQKHFMPFTSFSLCPHDIKIKILNIHSNFDVYHIVKALFYWYLVVKHLFFMLRHNFELNKAKQINVCFTADFLIISRTCPLVSLPYFFLYYCLKIVVCSFQ